MSLRRLRTLIVDDQQSQIDDIRRNLAPALESVGYLLDAVAEYEDHTDATQYLVRNPNSVDLIVTDVLWPKGTGRPPRQHSPGLQVIRYGEKQCPDALIVALSLGDKDHISIDRDAVKAGAHVVRLHEKDLPGDDGSGWLELGQTISRALETGRPYPISPSPGVSRGPDEAGVRSLEGDVQDIVAALRRLGQICRPLVQRRRGRVGINVTDEHDAQDFVEVVLRTMYEDVRSEERTPSLAGSSSTIDFLVKSSAIAVEVKLATATHRERRVKEEVLIDLSDYKGHPSVRAVVAAVFDMDGVIRNQRGFEDDLSGESEDLVYETIVVDVAALRGSS